jgi:hypothetical protein
MNADGTKSCAICVHQRSSAANFSFKACKQMVNTSHPVLERDVV